MSAVAHNINNKSALNQREEMLGELLNVFFHVWLRLGFLVSNRMSVEVSRNKIISGGKFVVPGEKLGLLKRKNNLF